MKYLHNIKHHLVVLIIFIGISFTYFSPVIEGKRLDVHDRKTWLGMSKEVNDFRKQTDQEALWTNSMFSGMPAYQISTKYKANLVQYVDKILSLGLARPANLLFLYLLGFYILLLSLKVDYRISCIGAIAFAFSSYFFIIIQAGHMTKAHAIAYFPMVIAAVIYTYRKNMLFGGVLTALALSLQIYCNHLQITYYLALTLILFSIIEFIHAYKKHEILDFVKRSGVLVLSILLASGTSFTRLSTTMEYGKESTRGKSELTDNIDNKTSGLDKDYATQWSYGIAETFTLLIPNFHGGASQGELGTDSETYQVIKRSPNAKRLIKNLPLYWGDQPIVSGPTYAGAIVVFLFFLGLFFIQSRIRIWLVSATILSIMLAWGKNFMPLTELFLEYFPGYNKFRAVSMILVIAEFTLPLLGFFALNKFLSSNDEITDSIENKQDQKLNKLSLENKKLSSIKLAFYITGGLSLLFAVFPSLFFDFVGSQDALLEKNGWPIEALQNDRKSLLSQDAMRSFTLILLTFLVLWSFVKNRLHKKYAILVIGFLVLIEMWTVNKRYLNNDDFARKSKVEKPYKMTQADQYILQDEDISYRVFNQSVSTFNDASTSYFHKSIGGYHGAKLKRYQELIENHISRGNMNVINMLNTRYFITPQGKVSKNINALGNAWFVDSISIVEDADQEIEKLGNIDTRNIAVVDKRYVNQIGDFINLDKSNNTISLDEYKPNYLKYNCNAINNGIVIFSEIYYEKGWNAYINGVKSDHFRTNYVLRGMSVPKGKSIIEYKFEPLLYGVGEKVSLASSLILFLLLIYTAFKR